MSTDLVSSETPVSTPAVAEQPQADAPSIADHGATFSPQAREAAAEAAADDPAPAAPVAGETPAQAEQRARDEQGRFARERHRAKSQQAGPQDVPRIRELTRKLRDTERIVQELQSKVMPPLAPLPVVPPAITRPQVQTTDFAKPKPRIEEYQSEEDPLDAWILAVGRWDRERERHEATKTDTVAASRAAETESRAAYDQWLKTAQSTYQEREAAFAAKTPNYRAVVDKATTPITPLLHQALLTSDNGPELVYYLATHPSVYDEMLLLTDGKVISEQTVANTQRLLASRSQAAPTGSAAAFVARSTPKPPNPVRTGPMPPADDPPGETSSIADHQRYYGTPRR